MSYLSNIQNIVKINRMYQQLVASNDGSYIKG